MTNHNYKLVGIGKTTRIADRDLRGKKTGLLKKLKISEALTVVRTEFKGLYVQKTGANVEGPSSFAMESEKGWDDVRTRAAITANLRKYTVNYTIEEYLKLTQAQLEMLKKKQPPAGPMRMQSTSALDYLRR